MHSAAKGLLGCFGASAVAAGVGGLGARRAPEVYAQLSKPAWAPPAGVFGPVWTGLYTSMAIAAWRIWQRGGSRGVLALHGAQLVVNAAWPVAFFDRRAPGVSVGIIAVLDALVVAEVAAAYRRDRVAAGLLVPYLGWCLFATALDVSVSFPRRESSR